MSLLEFKSVYFKYQDSNKFALENLSFAVRPGERVAIIGENGAGKTTALKHMNGLLRPTSGDVYVDGVNTKSVKTADLAKKVGLVFQNPNNQFFAQTCWDEVAFALKNFGYDSAEISAKVERALRDFGLIQYKDESPFALSVGEKKRLSIASVLVYQPEILVLDEPTAGQDAGQKRRIGSIIRNFPGKAVVASTHDLDFVVEYFDRVIVMSAGKAALDGTVREVFYGADLEALKLVEPQVVTAGKRLGLDEKPITLDEFLSAVKEAIRR